MKFKKIAAVISAAAVALALAGCSAKDDNGVYVDKDGNISINESKFENHVNSVFGGGNDTTPSTASETSEPEKFKLVVTDEIKNADFGSGKVQINNDIFELAAQMTVAELVEKYRDNYDFTYQNGTYEERKDYLLEYQNYDDGSTKYTLSMIPKLKGASTISVKIDNVTSPDEKITLDKAVVIGFYYNTLYRAIFPGGFMGKDLVNNGKNVDGFENPYESYNVKTLPEYLKSLGFEETQISVIASSAKINSPDEKLCWEQNGWHAKLCGEMGLNGKIPVYQYDFRFDSNTDKLSYVEFDYYFKTFE